MFCVSMLIAVASLVPAQAGGLEVSNIRPTYGMLGPSRPDYRILPGEVLPIAFDIAGLQSDELGRMRFAVKMRVEDAQAKAIYNEDLGELPPFLNVLGGGKVQHAVVVSTGLKQPPGTYRVKATITDLNSRKEAAIEKDFTVLPADLGLVRCQLSYDRNGLLHAPTQAVIGQTLYLSAVVVGFKPDAKEKEGNVSVELSVLDDKDKPTQTRPLKGEFRNLDAESPHVPFLFDLPIHRAGRYKLTLKATDNVTKRTATLTLPFNVVDVK